MFTWVKLWYGKVSSDMFDREESAFALAKAGDPRGIELLIERLASAHYVDYHIRASAADALGRLRQIEPLIKALKDHPFVGCAAAEALGNWGYPNEVKTLKAAIEDRNLHPDVRKVISKILARLHEPRSEPLPKPVTNSDINTLITELGHHDYQRRWAAAIELGKSGDPRAVDPLIAALSRRGTAGAPHGSYDEWIAWKSDHWAAIKALGKLNDRRAINPLVEILKRRDACLAVVAAAALGELGDPSAVTHLVEVLDCSPMHIRIAAAKALGRLGDPDAVEPLTMTLWDLDSEFSDSVRPHAAVALGKLGAIEALIEALLDGPLDVPHAAAEGLGRLGEDRTIECLIGGMGGEKSGVGQAVEFLIEELGHSYYDDRNFAEATGEVEARRAVVSQMEGIQNGDTRVQRAIESLIEEVGLGHYRSASYETNRRLRRPIVRLIEALSGGNTDVRHAIETLIVEQGGTYSKRATEVLKKLVETLIEAEWLDVSGRAAELLGKLGDRRAVKPLIRKLQRHPGSFQASYISAIEALAKLGDRRAVKPLIRILECGDPWSDVSNREATIDPWVFRRAAAEAVGELGDPRAVEPLIRALWQLDPHGRRTAAEALGKLGDKRAVPGLEEARFSMDFSLRRAADEALAKLRNISAADPVAARRDRGEF